MEYMTRHGYEQVVFCHDPDIGLKAIIAIHNTTLGPALGGIRVWQYADEKEALLDVLRLAKAMTLKSAAAGLNLGGGKTVVMGPIPSEKRDAYFRSLGRFIQSLGGRYICTEDVGTYVRDIEELSKETKFVTGISQEKGGSGDPSPMTAIGVYQAMKACAEEIWGSPSLKNKRVAIQGLGKVGSHLAQLLLQENAEIAVSDIQEAAIRKAREMGLKIVDPEEIYDQDCDIFSPCALGGVLNRNTIPRLRCRIVCGAANNQLEEEMDEDRLHQRGILYIPDFIANAGGVINLSFELIGYDKELARKKVEAIYETTEKVLALAKAQGITPGRAAERIAQERISAAKAQRKI